MDIVRDTFDDNLNHKVMFVDSYGTYIDLGNPGSGTTLCGLDNCQLVDATCGGSCSTTKADQNTFEVWSKTSTLEM